MVVFCLISPDYATCFLALHKHLVSVVGKRLSSVASLALSTLAPMIFLSTFNTIFFQSGLFLHLFPGVFWILRKDYIKTLIYQYLLWSDDLPKVFAKKPKNWASFEHIDQSCHFIGCLFPHVQLQIAEILQWRDFYQIPLFGCIPTFRFFCERNLKIELILSIWTIFVIKWVLCLLM